MQTARVTFLTTPESKAAIAARAAQRGMSTGEFIRLAVEAMPEESDEVEELALIVNELVSALPEMKERLERTSERLEAAIYESDRRLREAGIRK